MHSCLGTCAWLLFIAASCRSITLLLEAAIGPSDVTIDTGGSGTGSLSAQKIVVTSYQKSCYETWDPTWKGTIQSNLCVWQFLGLLASLASLPPLLGPASASASPPPLPLLTFSSSWWAAATELPRLFPLQQTLFFFSQIFVKLRQSVRQGQAREVHWKVYKRYLKLKSLPRNYIWILFL